MGDLFTISLQMVIIVSLVILIFIIVFEMIKDIRK